MTTRAENAAMYTAPQMANPIDLAELRAKGVTRASFHADGSLASVEFGPPDVEDEDQHEASNAPPRVEPKRSRSTGQLVPRVVVDSQ